MPKPQKGTDRDTSKCKFSSFRKKKWNFLCCKTYRVFRGLYEEIWNLFSLLQETDVLEDEKTRLQKEIANLQKEKEKLELVLEAHRPICKAQDSDSDSDSNTRPELPSLGGIKIEPADCDMPGPSTSGLAKADKPKPKITIPPPSGSAAVHVESEALNTPVLMSTPSLTPFTSSLVFTYPTASLDASHSVTAQNLSLSGPSTSSSQSSIHASRKHEPCGIAHRRSSSSGDQSDHSLNSPTILTLWSSEAIV